MMEVRPCPAAVGYVAYRTGVDPAVYSPCQGIGIYSDGVFVGGVVFHEYRRLEHGSLCQLSGALEPGCRLTCGVLKAVFDYLFREVGVTRLQAVTAHSNFKAQRFVKRLGFREEGRHRRAWDGREDAVVLAMYPESCRWINGQT